MITRKATPCWYITTVRLYKGRRPAVFFGSSRDISKGKARQYINQVAGETYQECATSNLKAGSTA